MKFKTVEDAVKWLVSQGIDEEKAKEMAPDLVEEADDAADDDATKTVVTVTDDDSPEAIAKRIREKLEEGSKANEDLLEIERLVNAQIASKAAVEKKAAEDAASSISYQKTSEADMKAIVSVEKMVSTPSKDEEIIEFQKACDDFVIINSVLASKAIADGKEWKKSDQMGLKTFGRIHDFLQPGQSRLGKALYSTGTNVGDEWVPTGFSASLEELFHLMYKVAGLFSTINMPTNPYTLPVELSDATAYLATESAADEATKARASTPGTTSLTLTAVKLMARTIFSSEADEDSIIPILPWVREQVAKAIVFAVEDAILNGDTTATHQDSTVTDGQDARKAWIGLRKEALRGTSLTTSFSNAEPTLELMRNVRELLTTKGADPSNLAWIVSALEYIKILGITQVLTLDKYGPGATVLTGELAKLDGISIVVSEKMSDAQNASGVIDESTTDRSSLLLTYLPAFLLGERSGVTVRSVEDIETDQTKMVSKVRMIFNPIYPSTTATNNFVALGYNIAT